MNILIVGGGGREHAIAWSLSKSKKVGKLYAIPGNGGISQLAECVPSIKATEVDKIMDFVNSHADIDYTVVASDDPIALGLVDMLLAQGHKAFGPTKQAAKLEWSKAYAKDFMQKNGIPTADYTCFSDFEQAKIFAQKCKLPIVIKADGLCVGKGVFICHTREDVLNALSSLMIDKIFGKSGNTVVFEEFLTGYEVSLLTFCDGETIVAMPPSHDYKKAFDNDIGLNTGGMGTYSPSEKYTNKLLQDTMTKIVYPTLAALKKENILYRGVIYFGLMVTLNGTKVIEYNSRFGDPETQVVLPQIETDLLDVFLAVSNGELKNIDIKYSKDFYVCVILASGGYPQSYEVGKKISVADIDSDCILFHSGTKFVDGTFYTNGGRVLGVVCKGKTIIEAKNKVYKNIKKISFEDMHYRSDIANTKEEV